MKVIAVLDMIEMPTVCKECRFREGALKGDDLVWLCHLNDEYIEINTKDDYCPLRPLPQKRINKDCLVVHEIWNEGWNACLDEITGETE